MAFGKSERKVIRMILETERLTLRMFTEKDMEALFLILKDEEVPVCFKWCDGRRFEIYNRREDATELKLLASGSYVNVATDLTLTFEKDSTFGLQGQKVNLTGTLN